MVSAGAVVASATPSAAPTIDRVGAGLVNGEHRPSAVAPIARDTTVQALRRITSNHRDLLVAVLVPVVLAWAAAVRLARDRDPIRSRQLLHSIVRGRSPPLLQVVR